MKQINIFLGLTILLAFMSCEDMKFDSNVAVPNLSISVQDPTVIVNDTVNAGINDTVYITVNSDAQYLAYYKGDTTHKFERSRTYALWQFGIDAFYDQTFRLPVTNKVTEREWKFYEYNSVEDIKAAGFSFNNATAELGEFDQPSTAYMAVNNRKQLHLNVPSYSQPSSLILTPDSMFVGKNEFGIVSQTLYMELYFISDAADAALRESSGIIGQSRLKVKYVMKDGKNFSHQKSRLDVKDNISINYQTKNPLLYPGGGGDFLADRRIFTGMVNQQIDSVIIQFGSGVGIVGTDTTKYYGFSGDVYIVSMRLGDTHYRQWDEGADLYTDYELEQKSEHEVKLVYKTAGVYNFWAVGTNVGRKIYTDDNNYQNQYGFSSKDYDIKRNYVKATIKIN